MRLSAEQIVGIKIGLTPYINDKPAELRLYGSRADVTQKGGDIDLLLILFNIDDKNTLNAIKHKLLANIKKNIGDQRIDLNICHAADIEMDEFLKVIYPESLVIASWNVT